MTHILRCRNLADAHSSLAALYSVSPAELKVALPLAARRAQEDTQDPIGALPRTLATTLKRTPAKPTRIHYFHGTRASDPELCVRERPRSGFEVTVTRDRGSGPRHVVKKRASSRADALRVRRNCLLALVSDGTVA
jgi:hypothetical protein